MDSMLQTPSLLVQQDRSAVWHPFTQMKTANPPIPIVRAQGAYLYDETGTSYLDAISSWWVNIHGHAHPYIAKKIARQAAELEHVIFADFTHPPAIELASRLLSILPSNMSKIFFSDNGSTAVEVALKMALQFWHNKGVRKNKIICFRNSYHGDTFGAMSAAGKNEFNRPFWRQLFDVESIDIPKAGQEEESLNQLKRIASTGEIACFIFEPLVLGTGGMVMYSPHGIKQLIQYCKEQQILTIADEVMTGFGRTGTLFACEQILQKPDLICLSKGLTGGFLPLGVTACSSEIFEAFLGNTLQSAFLHGHSYTANPIACSSALANLDLLSTPECAAQRREIATQHQNFCEQWREHPQLKRCEALGTILAIEYQSSYTSYFNPLRDRLYQFFLGRGILLRPLGNVLYILPPYCIQVKELKFIYDHITTTFEGEF